MRHVIVALCALVFSAQAWALCPTDAGCIAPLVVPQYDASSKSIKEWSPSEGEVFSYGNRIAVRMRFDEESLRILRHNDDFGLEVDVVLDGEGSNIPLQDIQARGFPADAKIGRDTPVFDGLTNHGTRTVSMHILRPQVLQTGTDYYAIFVFDRELPASGLKVQIVNFQLTIDVMSDHVTVLGLASHPVGSFLGLLTSPRDLDQYQHFVLETDSHQVRGSDGEYRHAFLAYPDGRDAMCWYDKLDSVTCATGQCVAKRTPILWQLLGISTAHASSCGVVDGMSVPVRNEVYGDRNAGTGNAGSTPTPPTPVRVNLTQDTDILGPDGQERKAERGTPLYAGEHLTVRTRICAHGGDAADARVKNGKKIDTVFEVKLPGQGWQQFATEETRDSNLRKDQCHTEQTGYVVPDFVGSQISFRTRIDARDEIRETDERDNVSREEGFSVGVQHMSVQGTSGKSWSDLTPDEKTALMTVITSYSD